ncbi:hypothetical protein, partial [Chitinivorax sp. B]|uniref:hypothetical protein n=1 Tax=Chitinivorax sp. B TaxID=2502235 RepID=UPI0014857137
LRANNLHAETWATIGNGALGAIGNIVPDMVNGAASWLERFAHTSSGALGRMDSWVAPRNDVAKEVAGDLRNVAGGLLAMTPVKFGKAGVVAEQAKFTEVSFPPKQTRKSAAQVHTDLTPDQAIENLVANGYSKNMSKDGTVSILENGNKTYRFYPKSTGGGVAGASSGIPSASVEVGGKVVTKLRFPGK